MHHVKHIIVDDNNQNLIGKSFSEIIPYHNQYWKVKENTLYGLYEMNSLRPILQCNWESIAILKTGFIVSKFGLYGWYDTFGNCILPCTYKKISESTLCLIVQDSTSKVGAFRHDGSEILPCIWEKILPYSKALIAYRNKKSTVYDYCGQKINK